MYLIQALKNFLKKITCYKTCGITNKKKCQCKPHRYCKTIQNNKINSLLKGNVERQPMKKMLNVYSNAILNFISVKYIILKDDVQYIFFARPWPLIVKNQSPLYFVKNI